MAGNKEAKSETIKLTITMLVSNRIDTIRKCMDSINPLLQKIPSELIVVDTGSTDGSIDIVREYTDRIVPFAWCNDFAAARNAGLKEAKGEWVMFLDDDEWFEDVTEIVDFFKSGEYREYNRGVYLVRNYGNAESTEWMDSNAPRMVRRFPGTQFEGVVHEVIVPSTGPTRYFSAYAHHYGYVYATMEEQRNHFQRNLALMEKELERNPGDARMLAQEAQEYFGMHEFYKAQELCEKVIGLYRRDPLERAYAGYCYNVSLRVYMRMESWKKAYEWGDRILAEGAPTSVALMGTVREMVTVCRVAEKYSEGVRCVEKYLDLYDSLKGKVNKEEICFDLSRYFQEEMHENAYLEGISLAVLDKDWKMAERWLMKKDWDAAPLVLFRDTLDHIMELWTVTTFRQRYSDILDRIMKSEAFQRQIGDNMEKYAGGEDKEAYHRLLRIFGNSRDDSAVSRGYRFLYHASTGQVPEDVSLEKMLEKIWEETANPLLWDMGMWDAVSRNGLSLHQLVSGITYDRWTILVRQWLEGSMQEEANGVSCMGDMPCLDDGSVKGEAPYADEEDGMAKVYHALCPDGETGGSLHMQFLELKFQEGVMRRRLGTEGILEQMTRDELLSCLEGYCDEALEFYAQIYQQALFTGDMATFLPPEGAFAVHVKQAAHNRQEGSQDAYMQLIAKAAKCYPVMKEPCKALLQKEEESSRNEITDAEQLEFVRLAGQLKQKVKILLENGDNKTAKQIIQQLKLLILDDEELEVLEKAAEISNNI